MGTFQRIWSPSRRVLEVLAGIGKEIQESKRIVIVSHSRGYTFRINTVWFTLFFTVMLFALGANLAVPNI